MSLHEIADVRDGLREAPRDGPIRSRLVHDGYLNEAEHPSTSRPAGTADPREAADQGRTSGPPSTSGRPARIGVGIRHLSGVHFMQ